MKNRLIWIVAIGTGLALILLLLVQVVAFIPKTPLTSGDDVTLDTQARKIDTGLTPVFFSTISEYGFSDSRKLRIKGTSEPNAVLTLLSENTRLRQIKSDEVGNWDVELDIQADKALALEVVMFVEGGLSVRGDETIYRLPVPRKKDEAKKGQTTSDLALIMVSVPGGPSRIVQSPFGGSPTSGPLTMGPIDYDDSGGVILSGTTEAEGRVRIYAGGEAFGETRVGAGGRWNFIAGNLLPRGEYPLSAELINLDGVKARVSVPFVLLPPSKNNTQSISSLPDVKYEPFRWQVRRALIGGGHQTTAIFAPIEAEALIVETRE